MRGRKKKPIALTVIEGNPGRRPIPNAPEPPKGDLPEPPAHLDAYGQDEWHRIAEGLHLMGVLNQIDQQTLAAYCVCYSRWRHAEEEITKRIEKAGGNPLAGLVDQTSNGNWIQNCLVGISNTSAKDMMRYAAEFGLTPAARARLAIDPGKGKSKFDGLIGMSGGKKNR